MKFSYGYPINRVDIPEALLDQHAITTISRAAEDAGFYGISFTDHPAPSQAWHEDGGHDALDPFVALAFAAAVTTRLRLIPYLVVVPYRNPFVIAKASATLDRFSSGRFTLAVGTGYMRAEFEAQGVAFDKRNDVFDRSMDLIRRAWAGEPVVHEGGGLRADAIVSRPTPMQRPYPPIWIGGNSAQSRARVAAYGAGWMPIPTAGRQVARRKTAALQGTDQLRGLVDDLRERFGTDGRVPVFDVSHPFSIDPKADAAAVVDEIGALAGAGVTWLNTSSSASDVPAALDAPAWFGVHVIAPLSDDAPRSGQ